MDVANAAGAPQDFEAPNKQYLCIVPCMSLTPCNNNSHSLHMRCVLSQYKVPDPWIKLFIGYRHQTENQTTSLCCYFMLQKQCITFTRSNICPLHQPNKAKGMSFPPLISECPPAFLLTKKQNVMRQDPLQWRNVCNTSYVPIAHPVQKPKWSHTNGTMISSRLILSLYRRKVRQQTDDKRMTRQTQHRINTSEIQFNFFKFFISLCQIYNERNEMPSTQLLYVMFSMRQHVLSSKGQLQASGIKYIKELYIIVMFRIETLILRIC